MKNKVWTVGKTNFKTIAPAYLITLAALLAMLTAMIINVAQASGGRDVSNQILISLGNTLYLLPVFAAIFIQGKNFRRFINLGAISADFLKGSLLCYVILAVIVSGINLVLYYTADRALVEAFGFLTAINFVEVFGWATNGLAVAFVQQFAFLMFIALFFHTFVLVQGSKIGLFVDIAIVAVICVFTPIEPLRNVEAGFFKLIIFEPNALLQIIICIGLGAVLYLLNKLILQKKPIG